MMIAKSTTAQIDAFFCSCGCGRVVLPSDGVLTAARCNDDGHPVVAVVQLTSDRLSLVRLISSEEARALGEGLIRIADSLEQSAMDAAAAAIAKATGGAK